MDRHRGPAWASSTATELYGARRVVPGDILCGIYVLFYLYLFLLYDFALFTLLSLLLLLLAVSMIAPLTSSTFVFPLLLFVLCQAADKA